MTIESTDAFIEEVQTWGAGQTGPAQDVELRQKDRVTPTYLTGYAAWFTFWYVGATEPHVIGQAQITDPLQGAVRYRPTGAESVTAGRAMYQIEVMNPGSADGSVEEWGTYTSDPFRVNIMDSQP